MLESQVELLERQKADLQAQLEDLASSGGDKEQKIVELTAQIQTMEQEKNTAEQNLITANAKVEEYENLKETLAKTTVTEDKILKDYKAYKDGQLITGTMENYAGQTVSATTVTESGENAEITIPQAGYYDTTSKISIPASEMSSNLDNELKFPHLLCTDQLKIIDNSDGKYETVSFESTNGSVKMYQLDSATQVTGEKVTVYQNMTANTEYDVSTLPYFSVILTGAMKSIYNLEIK